MSRDAVQRGAMIVFGLGAIGVAAWVTAESSGAASVGSSVVRNGADAAPTPLAVDAGGSVPPVTDAAVAAEDLDAGLALPSLSFGDAARLTSGPKKIRVGIVLVTFAGAEGAPSSARSKAAALTVAQRLADEAKADFKAAVKGGDPGSDADFGHLERGILSSQPQAEAAVFGLEPGEVSEVVETTRGFWIVKRID